MTITNILFIYRTPENNIENFVSKGLQCVGIPKNVETFIMFIGFLNFPTIINYHKIKRGAVKSYRKT